MANLVTPSSSELVPTEKPGNLGIKILSVFFVCLGCLFFVYICFKLVMWVIKRGRKRSNREKITEGFNKVCDGCRRVKDHCSCKEEESHEVISEDSTFKQPRPQFDNTLSFIKEEEDHTEEGSVKEDDNKNEQFAKEEENMEACLLKKEDSKEDGFSHSYEQVISADFNEDDVKSPDDSAVEE
ncbi:uncharacterized protein LOC117120679 [Anneissia japonica]|uniref:uncharacterized protein LOC117120679 n=1 Tax=Anneissia japonica TaxID=1529436 RepID=UPI001425B9B5|nr:uncharacterized protein LOC117120679 [Anneissia japonica]XP_033121601.1 uncharacterized protein LOC117120679 [Anneissia japonica]XP_033121602.1 uncharacterized protein LOC117120679 [Anneissia japonica]